MGGFSSFTSSSSGFGGNGCMSKSVSTSTQVRNGKPVTVTKTTITKPDGTTEVTEKI